MLEARLVGWVDRRANAARGVHDPEQRRRARLVLWFALVLETQCVLFAALHWILHQDVVAWMIAGLGVTLTTVPWVLRRTSVPTATHWLVAQLLLLIDGAAWYSGAIHAPSIPWSVIVPVMATMAGGRRAGWIWLVVVLANAGLFAAATLTHTAPPSGFAPWQAHALVGVAVAMLALVSLVYAVVYESSHEAMHAERDAVAQDMRQVLDHVGQGFFTAGPDGRPGPHRSAALTTWFGPQPADQPFWCWVAADDRDEQLSIALAWESLFDDVLPIELALEQMPRELRSPGRAFDLAYTPVRGPAGDVRSVVVVVEDVRARVDADASERLRTDQAALLARMLRDRRGFVVLREEVHAILHRLELGVGPALRDLHTLKGVVALWGLATVAARCHELESALLVDGRKPSSAELDALRAAWAAITEPASTFVDSGQDRIEISADDLRALEEAVARGEGHASLTERLATWRYEPTAVTFGRLAEQTEALARRLDKGPLTITIEDHGLRLDPATWGPVWAALVHPLRNALDHGLDTAAERAAHGKAPRPELRLISRREGPAIILEVIDDGRGIDWERVRARARDAGRPYETARDLEDAILSDGFSTRDEVTELSGRGVGMGALVAAARKVGGEVTVESTPGRGTTIRLTAIPLEPATRVRGAARRSVRATA